MNLIAMLFLTFILIRIFYIVPALFMVFIVNLVFHLLPYMMPRISKRDVFTYQLFSNCIFLLYFILPTEYSEFNPNS